MTEIQNNQIHEKSIDNKDVQDNTKEQLTSLLEETKIPVEMLCCAENPVFNKWIQSIFDKNVPEYLKKKYLQKEAVS